MAGLAAVNQVGESIVKLLDARRELLSADGLLGPVPKALKINHVSLSDLANKAEPTSDCSLTCYRVKMSDHPAQRMRTGDAPSSTSLAVDLHYLVTAWPSKAADEQAIISWIMLELLANPLLDRSLLPNDGSWGSDETVQIVPDTMSDDELFRIWSALQRRYRMSATFKARVVRIGYGQTPDYPAVVASRFGFANVDPMAETV